ncbi:MAG: hypothetical protein JO110_02470, partial [Acetobacteraceae bacterium]|nr:hypothetical protein [Acetobacteraceae bacterium]
MSFSRKSYTERRRQMLARKFGERLDQYEHRNMITESLGLWMLGIGLPASALAHVRSLVAGELEHGPAAHGHRPVRTHEAGAIDTGPAQRPRRHPPTASGGVVARPINVIMPPSQTGAGDWLTLTGKTPTPQAPVGAGAD